MCVDHYGGLRQAGRQVVPSPDRGLRASRSATLPAEQPQHYPRGGEVPNDQGKKSLTWGNVQLPPP